MVNESLTSKYENINFYCHNLGGYDVIFILKILYDYNDSVADKKDQYKITSILRDEKIIDLKIRKNNNRLIIRDSYALLTDKLASLAVSFEVPTLKSNFPYGFSIENNLNYIGSTPSIDYYENINQEEYKKLLKSDLSFKNETIKYLNDDINCLYEVLKKANIQFFQDYNIDMRDKLTISGLALRIYLRDYYKNNIPAFFVNKDSVYRDIKQAYYGGITEVYKPTGSNLYYYDVNSLYPYASLNDMPGLECTKIQFFKYKEKINNLFGFFYCEIETTNNNYLGLLPYRTKKGIIFPQGKWYGWYFSE
uniref:Probable DNA polymerase n=1 Tax=Arthonia quintaria TaxID=2563724 RepID=A0A4P8VVD5_9PEZI|nr:hypothetical protein [Arthonia quintaria]